MTRPRLKNHLCVSWASVLDSQLRNGRSHHTCNSDYNRHPIHFVDLQSISLLESQEGDSVVLGATVVVDLSLSSGRKAANNIEVGIESVQGIESVAGTR